MVRVENEFITNMMQDVKYEKNVQKKSKIVSEIFPSYVLKVEELTLYIKVVFDDGFHEPTTRIR